MLGVKQEGIKYHFLSLLYNLAKDWTPVSRTIGEQSNRNTFETILVFLSNVYETKVRIKAIWRLFG